MLLQYFDIIINNYCVIYLFKKRQWRIKNVFNIINLKYAFLRMASCFYNWIVFINLKCMFVWNIYKYE